MSAFNISGFLRTTSTTMNGSSLSSVLGVVGGGGVDGVLPIGTTMQH